MKGYVKLIAAGALSAFLFGASHSIAMAQEDISQKQIASLDLTQADVREAIRALFKNINVSYSIAPEVQGPVTVNLKNVSVEIALQNILRQVDATYRVEAGVYEIIKKQNLIQANASTVDNVDPKQPSTILRRIRIRSIDPAVLAMLLGGKGGNQNYDLAPERSTINKTQSGGGSGGGSGFGSGSSGSNGYGGNGGSGSSGFGGNGLGSGSGGSGGSGRGGFGG